MKYEAVIFDLFGTLVGDMVGPLAMEARGRMAEILKVPLEDFNKKWSESYIDRNTGAFPSIKDNLLHICRELSGEVDDVNATAAAQIRQDLNRQVMMRPRTGAIEVISELKKAGLKTGLISNCEPAPPGIWPETPFSPLINSAVFSCSAGFMKPDNRIYKRIIDRLSATPEVCLYVSNGQGGELRGAYEVGMLPVLITPDEDKELHIISPEEDEITLAERAGRVISSLQEILAFLE